MRSLALRLAVLSIVLSACGGGQSREVIVTGPFTPEHEVAFENGVDFIDDPTILEGAWRRDWQTQLQQRAQLSDAVALVTVTTMRHDLDLERRETYRVVARVEDRRHGGIPDEVTFVVRQGEPGFDRLRDSEERLLNHRFIAFVKWVEESGQVDARWHLSPAAEGVLEQVEQVLEERRAPHHEGRVIVREY